MLLHGISEWEAVAKVEEQSVGEAGVLFFLSSLLGKYHQQKWCLLLCLHLPVNSLPWFQLQCNSGFTPKFLPFILQNKNISNFFEVVICYLLPTWWCSTPIFNFTVFSIICILQIIRWFVFSWLDPNWYNWWYLKWYLQVAALQMRFWSWVSHLFLKLQWYIFRQRIQYGGCCGMHFRVHSKDMPSCSEYSLENGFWGSTCSWIVYACRELPKPLHHFHKSWVSSD